MTGLPMNVDVKKFLLFIFAFLIITDIAILLDIPHLRQIFGFVFLTFVPGLLILLILKLDKLDLTERVVLVVGLSVSFLMLFGLLINNSLLFLGYKTPLATTPLLISFNITFILLSVVVHIKNKDRIFTITNVELNVNEKAFLIVPILFPALSIFGMHFMRTTDNNIVLIVLLFLIPIYIIFLCFLNRKFPNRLYPVILFLISLSLLLLLPLRSDHLIGIDIHDEYYFFQMALNNLHWEVVEPSLLNACLSISIYPAIYTQVLKTDNEFLFKILYPLIFSVSPLAIYILSKKYITELYAFFSACFFMFQENFLWTALHARTNIAIFFFVLVLMILFDEQIDPLKKRLLLIVFMVSCMVCHYATTYIFFFIMLGSFVGIEILSTRYIAKKVISSTLVILFFAMIFFWYSQVTETAFSAGITYVHETFINLNQLFMEELRSETIRLAMGQDLGHPEWSILRTILRKITFVVTWTSIVFIVIGIVTMVLKFREMVKISNDKNIKLKKPDFLKEKCDAEFFMIALVCFGLLVAMTILPYVSIHYGVDRLYHLTLTILSLFFVIGGIIVSKILYSIKQKFKTSLINETFKNPQIWTYMIILLVLIPYCLLSTNAIHTIAGISETVILNSEGAQYDIMYVHDHEIHGAKWLKSHPREEAPIYTDPYGTKPLLGQSGIRAQFPTSLFEDKKITKGYIYLRYYNVVEGKFIGKQRQTYNMTEYSDIFGEMSNVYANGGSEVWKK